MLLRKEPYKKNNVKSSEGPLSSKLLSSQLKKFF